MLVFTLGVSGCDMGVGKLGPELSEEAIRDFWHFVEEVARKFQDKEGNKHYQNQVEKNRPP